MHLHLLSGVLGCCHSQAFVIYLSWSSLFYSPFRWESLLLSCSHNSIPKATICKMFVLLKSRLIGMFPFLFYNKVTGGTLGASTNVLARKRYATDTDFGRHWLQPLLGLCTNAGFCKIWMLRQASLKLVRYCPRRFNVLRDFIMVPFSGFMEFFLSVNKLQILVRERCKIEGMDGNLLQSRFLLNF